MALIKWSPFFFEPLGSMDSMLDDMGLSKTPTSNIVPPVDLYETKDAIVAEIPLPGVDPGSIDIAIENGVLSIKGSSERKTEVDEKNYYRREVRSGSVFRQIPLPGRVEDGNAKASFENGILRVTIPKVEERKAIKVEIKKEQK